MAYTSGTTNYFANQAGGDKGILQCLLDFVCPPGAEYEENIGTGDGIEVTFAIALTNLPILFETCDINYIIGATPYTATLQDDDTFAGTGVSSGSLNRTTGVGSITFSTAPDDTTDIDATYWAGKTQHEQTVGTGDGIEVTFAATLVNLPIAVGQCRLRYKIGAVEYDGWLDGDDNIIGTNIASGTLNRATGALSVTFDLAILDTYEMKALYSTGEVEGQDWLILLQRTTRNAAGAEAYAGTLLQEVVLRNSGVSGDDSVVIGFREWYTSASSIWSWNMNGYTTYPPSATLWSYNLAAMGRTTYSGGCFTLLPSMYFKDAEANLYKFSSNKRRIMGVIRTSGTLDMPFYAGFGKRLVRPAEHRYPLAIAGNYIGAVAYSNASLAFMQTSALITINPASTYPTAANTKVAPIWSSGQITAHKRTPGIDEIILHPLYLYDDTAANPNKSIICELDGMLAFVSAEVISGDTIEVGTDVYEIFQNVYRTTFASYFCFLQET